MDTKKEQERDDLTVLYGQSQMICAVLLTDGISSLMC